MRYKYIMLPLLASFLAGCQTKEVIKPLVQQADGTLVVFDGGDNIQGKGFALPRGISKLEVSYERPKTNKTHLSYELKFLRGWTGGGWNWYAWDGEGNDISQFNNLVFDIAVFSGRINDITFQLTSKNKSGTPDGMGPKVSLLPFITKRGKYVRMTIPTKKLIGGNLDPQKVWGFNIGVFSAQPLKSKSGKSVKAAKSSKPCRIYLDQIEFTQ